MKNVLLILAVLLSVSICNSSSRLQAVTVPAGAAVRVRTIDPIDLNSARPGARFRGSLADSMKNRNGTVLIPGGAKVELRAVNVARPGRMRPRDRIDLKVDSVTFNGKIYPIVSSIIKSRDGRKGSRTLRSTGSGAGSGAPIGGTPRGGPGAAIGALVGGGGGTAVAQASAANLRIPSETVLSFQLQRALRVNEEVVRGLD
jgi:hypothetical protein